MNVHRFYCCRLPYFNFYQLPSRGVFQQPVLKLLSRTRGIICQWQDWSAQTNPPRMDVPYILYGRTHIIYGITKILN